MLGGLLTAVIMGGFIVYSRFGVLEALTAADLTYFRYMSGILLLPIFLKKDVWTLGGIGWKKGLVLTIFGGWPFSIILLTGFNYAPAAHGAVFGPGTMPMLTALLSWVFLKDRPSAYRLFGLITVMTGLVMLGWGGFLESNPGAWKGDLFFLGGAFCWASFSVAMRRWNVEPEYGIALVGVLSLLTFSPLYLPFMDSVFFRSDLSDLAGQIFYQGFLVGIIAVLFFAGGIKILGPTGIALFISLVPVFGTLIGIPVLGEIPGTIETVGILVVVLGMLAAMGVRPWRFGR